MPRWNSSAYYTANMSELIAHLVAAEEELKYFESLPQTPIRKEHGMSVAAYKAMRKRKVIAQLQRAIRARIAWHREQIALAKSRGIVADENFTPKLRSEVPREVAHVG